LTLNSGSHSIAGGKVEKIGDGPCGIFLRRTALADEDAAVAGGGAVVGITRPFKGVGAAFSHGISAMGMGRSAPSQ